MRTEKSDVKRSKVWGVILPLLIIMLALVAYSLESGMKQDPRKVAYLKTGINPLR